MARPPPSPAHDHDRLRLPPASSPQNSEAGKKESTVHRLNQLCPPCATPFSKSSLDHRRSVARVIKNGFAANSGVSESAKVVAGRGQPDPRGRGRGPRNSVSGPALERVRQCFAEAAEGARQGERAEGAGGLTAFCC